MNTHRRLTSGLLYTQSAMVLLPGIYGLVLPNEFMHRNGHPIMGRPSYLGHAMNCMCLISLGASFSLIASSPSSLQRKSFMANIPLRLLATLVYWRSGHEGSEKFALWELLWAGINAAALALS